MCVCTCVLVLSTYSTAKVMTSNTNPLDWDYSSSRAAAGRLEAEDWTSLGCLLYLSVWLLACIWANAPWPLQWGPLSPFTRDIKVTFLLLFMFFLEAVFDVWLLHFSICALGQPPNFLFLPCFCSLHLLVWIKIYVQSNLQPSFLTDKHKTGELWVLH